MKHKVYIPQGRGGRISKNTPADKFEGLYTDSISNCFVIIAVSKTGAFIVHVDAQTYLAQGNYEQIYQEITNIMAQETPALFLLYRESSGLIRNAIEFLKPWEGIYQVKIIKGNEDGISINLSESSELSLEPAMHQIGVQPQNLRHHPREQYFTTVQKIEQIVGVEDKFRSNNWRAREIVIFDALKWSDLSEQEEKISEPQNFLRTSRELRALEKSKNSFLTLYETLSDIVEALTRKEVPIGADVNDDVPNVTMYLEGYLNDYNFVNIFRANCRSTLDPKSDYSIFKSGKLDKEDLGYVTQALKLLDKFDEFKDLFMGYKSKNMSSGVKRQLVHEINGFITHYENRKYYCDKREEESVLLASDNADAVSVPQTTEVETKVCGAGDTGLVRVDDANGSDTTEKDQGEVVGLDVNGIKLSGPPQPADQDDGNNADTGLTAYKTACKGGAAADTGSGELGQQREKERKGAPKMTAKTTE